MIPKKILKIERRYPEKLKRFPKDKLEQNKLADELIEWALREDTLLLEAFPLDRKMSPYHFFKFAKAETNEYFTMAFDFARSSSAVKMIQGKHGMDINLIQKIFPVYHRQYHEYLMEREEHTAEIKKLSSGKEDINFVIKMEESKSDIKPSQAITIERDKS